VKETPRNSKNSKKGSVSFLDSLADGAYATVASGYYTVNEPPERHRCLSLLESIRRCTKNPVIAEVKFASPSQGTIQTDGDPLSTANAMIRGGATAISVLTEPKRFAGSLENLTNIRRSIDAPLMMKDIVVSPVQINAAARLGADAILLIYRLFNTDRCEASLEEMISHAHSEGLEVLLEVHDKEEFERVADTSADLIGVNNRDLSTFRVDLFTTVNILKTVDHRNKTVVSESGIRSAEDLRLLRAAGANAFLVGTSLMQSGDIESKVRELVEA
jgi:indole-3-glycerol phosphate synthase